MFSFKKKLKSRYTGSNGHHCTFIKATSDSSSVLGSQLTQDKAPRARKHRVWRDHRTGQHCHSIATSLWGGPGGRAGTLLRYHQARQPPIPGHMTTPGWIAFGKLRCPSRYSSPPCLQGCVPRHWQRSRPHLYVKVIRLHL